MVAAYSVLAAATLAIAGLLTGSSSSQAEQPAQSLTITIAADENGQMSSLTVGLAKLFSGPLESEKVTALDRRLQDVFPLGGFQQVVFRVDPRLNSGDLIKVINVCDGQKTADGGPIKKMSFVELSAD